MGFLLFYINFFGKSYALTIEKFILPLIKRGFDTFFFSLTLLVISYDEPAFYIFYSWEEIDIKSLCAADTWQLTVLKKQNKTKPYFLFIYCIFQIKFIRFRVQVLGEPIWVLLR